MSTNGMRKRRTFSEEFKRDAVNPVVVEGYTIAAAARAVNVLVGSLREWHRKEFKEQETNSDILRQLAQYSVITIQAVHLTALRDIFDQLRRTFLSIAPIALGPVV